MSKYLPVYVRIEPSSSGEKLVVIYSMDNIFKVYSARWLVRCVFLMPNTGMASSKTISLNAAVVCSSIGIHEMCWVIDHEIPDHWTPSNRHSLTMVMKGETHSLNIVSGVLMSSFQLHLRRYLSHSEKWNHMTLSSTLNQFSFWWTLVAVRRVVGEMVPVRSNFGSHDENCSFSLSSQIKHHSSYWPHRFQISPA